MITLSSSWPDTKMICHDDLIFATWNQQTLHRRHFTGDTQKYSKTLVTFGPRDRHKTHINTHRHFTGDTQIIYVCYQLCNVKRTRNFVSLQGSSFSSNFFWLLPLFYSICCWCFCCFKGVLGSCWVVRLELLGKMDFLCCIIFEEEKFTYPWDDDKKKNTLFFTTIRLSPKNLLMNC